MTETHYSGDWYLTISNEMPMTNRRKTLCKFDLTKYKDSFYGAPVNQFGSVEEVLDTLRGWQKISAKPEYDIIREINKEKITMENEFMGILVSHLAQRTAQQ